MTHLALAIKKLRPNAEFSFTNDDYSTVKWDVLDGKAPTQSEIEAAIEQVKADEITNATKAVADKAALLTKLGISEDEAKLLLQ